MNVDLLKSAISSDVRKDIAQAVEGDRMVVLNGKSLLVEQDGGHTTVYLVRRHTVPPGYFFMYRFLKHKSY